MSRSPIKPGPSSRGMTLIEVTVAMLVLSLVLVSVTQGVALSVKFQQRTDQELRGSMLASELAERVAGYAYADPTGADLDPIGRDAGELDSDSTTFDDVDDWDGYSETPPTFADGTDMSFLSGWTRSVTVDWVGRAAPDTVSASDGGAKLITVVVTRADGAQVGSVQRLVYDTTALGGD